jgi:hypothetical protein
VRLYLLDADTAGERWAWSGLELGGGALTTVLGEDFAGEGFVLLPLAT